MVPRSRGGTHSWSNVVAACKKHNHDKGSRLLEELGWELRIKPEAPYGLLWRIGSESELQPGWSPRGRDQRLWGGTPSAMLVLTSLGHLAQESTRVAGLDVEGRATGDARSSEGGVFVLLQPSENKRKLVSRPLLEELWCRGLS